MGVAPHQFARRLAFLVTVAIGAVIAVGLYAALWAPGSLDLTTARGAAGRLMVTWVAPDGPAWSAGVRPGDTVVAGGVHSSGASVQIVRAGRGQIVLGPRTVTLSPPDLLVAGLGLFVLLLGGMVLLKSQDHVAGGAFWRMSLVASVALGLVPAGSHGVLWALILDFVALRLAGPALLELALVFPGTGRRLQARFLLWLPVLLLLVCYAACWWQPVPLFPLVLVAAAITLAAYILTACIHLVSVLRRPRSARQRAQLQFLVLGLVCGFMPFVLLSLLPLIVVGKPLVPAQQSILALVLLPLSISTAIVRTEFLGITSLVHRRFLRALLGSVLLAGVALATGLLTTVGRQHWEWSTPFIAAGASVLTALAFTPLLRWITQRSERLFLRDAYDTAATLFELSIDLSQVEPQTIGPLVVARLTAVLDLSFALLLTKDAQWYHSHRRSTVPRALQETVVCRAQALLTMPPSEDAFVERVQHLPILFLPVQDRQSVQAVLCLGPKRSSDRYTSQDRALLGVLGRHLAVLFSNHQLHEELDAQIARLRHVLAERTVLTERVLSVAEQERRRLAYVLHDEAIQLGGEVVRSLHDLLGLPHLPPRGRDELMAVASLSDDLVTSLREVVAELHPPPLEIMGLVPALHELLCDAERRTGCTCTLIVDPQLEHQRVPAPQELALYHIAREAVFNALHHAQASSVSVSLCYDDDHLHLSVRDDGRGLTVQPVGQLLAAGHLGLALMQERTYELGGTWDVSTAPGAGTTIDVRVPTNLAVASERLA